ncbi:MAG: 4-hydroxythreonine-4-phosphate dehydrogenase PdxA [Planctomycetes bacterium]|nr:4-hydroxythreonine-4-phosphate dehydrogenase PdxA [Planctomycetota bacterium]
MGSPEPRPTIGITLGDPGGIGPEVVDKALSDKAIRKLAKFIVFGRDAETPIPQKLTSTHEPTADGGEMAVGWILAAIAAAMSGDIDAIVTAPISKEAIHLAGYNWPGHTEILKEKTGAERAVMTMVGGGLRVALATTHVAIAKLSSALKKDDVADTIRVTDRGMREYFGFDPPRIAVCGLNPHAGERGMFGWEEAEIIAPAMEAVRREGIDTEGPVPADVVFHQALKGKFDAVVAMYHDQATIPVKLLAFERGVNVTLGLPIIRTSPDHGTAFDIAGKGIADPGSMIEAIRLAADMARRKGERR